MSSMGLTSNSAPVAEAGQAAQTHACAHCDGPILGAGLSGRPWPNSTPASYCCFGCLSLGEKERLDQQSDNSSNLASLLFGPWLRLGISLVIAGQSMVLSLAINLTPARPHEQWFLQTGILLLTLVVVALLGGPLAATVWRSLRQGRLTVEALFVTSIVGAMAGSLQSMLRGSGAIYFDVVSIVLIVYTLNGLIGAFSRTAAIRSSRSWLSALSRGRLYHRDHRSEMVPVETIQAGDRVEVLPGEMFPVDGVIEKGSGSISDTPMSGEPFPRYVEVGNAIEAGSAAHDARFLVRATRGGTDRHIDRLIETVLKTTRERSALEQHVDRIFARFFPLVLATAVGTFLYWSWAAGWEPALFNAMAVLLVACPCALGLATPTALWATIDHLAQRGLVARTPNLIERLAQIDGVFFDKTGTLTDPDLQQVHWQPSQQLNSTQARQVLAMVAAVERRSLHPVAQAIRRSTREDSSDDIVIDSVHEVPGQGIDATVKVYGDEPPRCHQTQHALRIGRPEWLSPSLDPSQEMKVDGRHHRVDVEWNGRHAGSLLLEERPREGIAELRAELSALGLSATVLSGDQSERVRALGFPGTGQLSPEDKRDYLLAERAKGRFPLFVGDGTNDAPALVAAEAGIALASGTDLSAGVADGVLFGRDLRIIPWSVGLCRRAVIAIRLSIAWALFYNGIGMALAAVGLLHPVAAALLMVISSSVVAALCLAAPRVERKKPEGHAERDQSEGNAEWNHAEVRSPNSSLATPDHQPLPLKRQPATSPIAAAILLGLGLALQGPLIVLTVPQAARSAALVLSLFAILGGILAMVAGSTKFAQRPLWFHSAVGMISLGNFGMLVGGLVASWSMGSSAPHWCGSLPNANGEGSLVDSAAWVSFIGMAAGMILGSCVAMLRTSPRACSDDPFEKLVILVAGCLGMVAGMGGADLCLLTISWMRPFSFSWETHYLTMTSGMIVGMLWLESLATRILDSAGRIPPRSRRASTRPLS